MTGDGDKRPDSSPNRGSGGFFGVLRSLVDTLRELDDTGERRRSATRSRTSGGRQIDYGIDVGTLEGLGEGTERTQQSQTRVDVPTSVVEHDDGVTVYFDFPELAGDTIQAGVNGRRLAVGVDGRVMTRVTLPRSGLALQFGTYNNGVLECHLADTSDETEPER